MTFLLSVQKLIALKSNMEIKGKLRTKLPCSFCSKGVTFLDRLTHTYNHSSQFVVEMIYSHVKKKRAIMIKN